MNVFKKNGYQLINGRISVDGDSRKRLCDSKRRQVAYNQNNDRLASFVHNIKYEVQGETEPSKTGASGAGKAVFMTRKKRRR